MKFSAVLKAFLSVKFSFTFIVSIALIFSSFGLFSQSLTNSVADDVLKGNYNPNDYLPTQSVPSKDVVLDQIVNQISTDSLKSYLVKLESFYSRNTGSDTLSPDSGIGATRRWVHEKMMSFSSRNENRLLVSYLKFNRNICGVTHHKNVCGVLPGTNGNKEEVLVVEAHMDSRCESSCDKNCYAPGMDDNGSGTALVIELARVMSQYSFDRTIVFTTVTGEEQGLEGGRAWATYFKDNDIEVLACLNNDVVGGIECGKNSSPPSCSPEGSLDSMNLRIFSFSPNNDINMVSKHKSLARYVKLQQIEEINGRIGMNFNMDMQIREDREGRGGDHIPFRQKGFAAIRFTCAHEHGNGAGNAPDRQHTTTDILGYDLSIPPDGILDTFLVNFNYLRRNAITNGTNLSLLANSPPIPEPRYEMNQHGNLDKIIFENDDENYQHRIGVRSTASADLYYDTVIEVSGHEIHFSDIQPQGDVHLFPMNVDDEFIESLPSFVQMEPYLGEDEMESSIDCMQLYPNPAADFIQLNWRCGIEPKELLCLIYDAQGKLVYNDHIDKIARVEIGHFQAGNYTVKIIYNNQESFTQHLVIE